MISNGGFSGDNQSAIFKTELQYSKQNIVYIQRSTHMLLVIAIFTMCSIAVTASFGQVPSTDQVDTVWRGNDTLLDDEWFVKWGVVGWNLKLGILTHGFWGLEHLQVVADPQDVTRHVLQITYPKDGVTIESGTGLLFAPPVSLKNPKKACLSYKVLFEKDFKFGKVGGKLPGLFGFNIKSKVPLNATCCAGPWEHDASVCFSARISYRTLRGLGYPKGKMFFEVIPWMDESQCAQHPNWNCDLPYGSGMVIRTPKPETFAPILGSWTQIDQEIKLNDEGKSNGYIRIWYNGQLVIDESNISITTNGSVVITGILFHALFGQGFDLSQGSPVDQVSYISDVTISNSRFSYPLGN